MIPAEGQSGVKATLGYIVSLRPTWDARDPVSKKKMAGLVADTFNSSTLEAGGSGLLKFKPIVSMYFLRHGLSV